MGFSAAAVRAPCRPRRRRRARRPGIQQVPFVGAPLAVTRACFGDGVQLQADLDQGLARWIPVPRRKIAESYSSGPLVQKIAVSLTLNPSLKAYSSNTGSPRAARN